MPDDFAMDDTSISVTYSVGLFSCLGFWATEKKPHQIVFGKNVDEYLLSFAN